MLVNAPPHRYKEKKINANLLQYGLPKSLISKLQRVQNTAARIVYCMLAFCLITPLLFDLHWPPVKVRIHYNFIITTFTVQRALPWPPNKLSHLTTTVKIRQLNNPCNGVQLTTVRTLQGGMTVNQIRTLLVPDYMANFCPARGGGLKFCCDYMTNFSPG